MVHLEFLRQKLWVLCHPHTSPPYLPSSLNSIQQTPIQYALVEKTKEGISTPNQAECCRQWRQGSVAETTVYVPVSILYSSHSNRICRWTNRALRIEITFSSFSCSQMWPCGLFVANAIQAEVSGTSFLEPHLGDHWFSFLYALYPVPWNPDAAILDLGAEGLKGGPCGSPAAKSPYQL